MALSDKLLHYYPGAQWALNGETYEGLAWTDESPKPSKGTLTALKWPPDPSTNPSDHPLLPWQFKALVIYLGVDAQIRTAISKVSDDMQRAATLSRYENSSLYRFDGPMVNALRQAIGMSVEQLEAAWLQAKDLRSSN